MEEYGPPAAPVKRELAIAALAASFLAVLLTWPLAARLASAGRLDSSDGRFSIWNVAWVARALTSNPSQLYNANIFHPHENALAFSEPNLFAGLIAVPVWLATRDALAASNWSILCSFVLSFVAMYALARRLSASRAGAAFAAIGFAYAPYVLAHLPHVQLLMTFGLPLILLAMHDFVGAPGWRPALRLGAALALQALACGYYGIFGGLMAGFGVVWFAVTDRRWRDPRYWLQSIAAALTALVIVAPFFAPYVGVREAGFARTLDEARVYSADWRAYLVSPMWVHRWMVDLVGRTGTWADVLFPGLLPALFAVVALVVAAVRSPVTGAPPRRLRPAVVWFYATLAVAALWASFGPDAGLYALLYKTMPFFSMLRAPARIGLLVALSLAVLGAAGFAAVERRLPARLRASAIVLVLALSVAGSAVGGLILTEQGPVPLVYQRLASLPRGAVAEFPFWSRPGDLRRHTQYMLWSTHHWQPLINGYSDHIPAEATADMPRLATFPGADAWRALRQRGARYVVIHWTLVADDPARDALAAEVRGPLRLFLRPIVEQPTGSLYEIVAWPEP